MPRTDSAALPIAYVVLRILIVLNWIAGAAIFALLTATFVAGDWTLTALGIDRASWIRPALLGLQAVAALGIAAVPLYHMVLRRLLAIVDTVRAGDPFVMANAVRLQTIGWVLVALLGLSVAIGAIGEGISTEAHPVHLDAGFSTSGFLVILLTFVLARVFAEGARMRDDLEGTV